MTHIKKTDEFIKEMASYKKTWKNGFRSFLNHNPKYSDYQYTGNIVQSPFYDKMGCVILPFTKNTKLLPVLVWKDRQEDVETPMYVFIRQIKEFEIQQGDTLKDVLDIVGNNFRYDVKIEIHGINYKGTEEQNNFIVNEFEKYKLDYSKGDKKISIMPVDYNNEEKKEEPLKEEKPEIQIKNNGDLISSSGNRIYSNFSKNEKYRYFLIIDNQDEFVDWRVKGIINYKIFEYDYAAKGIYVRPVYLLPENFYIKNRSVINGLDGAFYDISNISKKDLIEFITDVSKWITPDDYYDIDIFSKYDLIQIY